MSSSRPTEPLASAQLPLLGTLRRLVPVTLTARLVVASVCLVALVSILISVVTTLAMRSYLVGQVDHDVRASAERVTGLAGPGGPGIPRIGLVAAFDQTSNAAEGSNIASLGERTPKQLTGTQLRAVAATPSDGELHSVHVPGLGSYRLISQRVVAGGSPLIIVTGLPMNQADNTLHSLVLWEVGLGLGGVVIAYGVGLALVRRTLRPLREVAQTAADVTALDLGSGSVEQTARVPERLTDEATEVGRVGASLNRLLGHVESALSARHSSEQQVRQFVADASHELRTPLSTIHGYAELARRTPEDAAQLSQSMAKVESEAHRMSALVEDLLLLTRLDSGRPLANDEVDVTRLLLEAVADARVVAPDHQWRLDLPEDPVTVRGDEQRLHQVVTNLLNNARTHTPAGTTVTVSAVAGRHGDSSQVRVHDDGPGLPPELVPHVFERFTRGDSSRTRASGGVGLGLSLVSAITHAHGGTVSVASTPGQTIFTVSLPSG